MKVLLLHSSLNVPGGGEKVCLTAIEALKESNYNVILVTAERTDWKKVKQYYGKTFVVEERVLLPAWTRIPGAYKRIATFPSKKMLMEADLSINMHGDTIIHPCNITYVHIPAFILKYIIYQHDQSKVRQLYLLPYTLFQNLFAKRHFKKTNILTNSTYLKQIIKKHLNQESYVLHPPVEVKKFQFPLINDRENIVVSCSRFSFEKRLELIPKIAKYCPTTEFYILGSTGIRSNYVVDLIYNQIDEYKLSNVSVKTNPTTSEILDIYSRAKIYLHSAIGEYFGISIVEGMASGLLPIVHKSGGAWIDIIQKGKYGLGYNTYREAAKKINESLNSNRNLNLRKKAQKRSKVFDKTVFKKKFVKIVKRYTEINRL